MGLSADAPMSDKSFRASTHKTYTDCYRMQGFVGGGWGYSLHTNATTGRALGLGGEELKEDQRRLAIYLLGWESVEVRLSYSS